MHSKKILIMTYCSKSTRDLESPIATQQEHLSEKRQGLSMLVFCRQPLTLVLLSHEAT